MAHYYIEFLEPKEGVSQEDFQGMVQSAAERWAKEHPEDELVLSIGRTWRLGPRPAYMTIWRLKDLGALGRWNEEFQKPKIAENHAELTEVATIVEAGLYADVGQEVW